jgi:hypothetical protein
VSAGENCVSALVFDSRETAEERLATLAGEYQLRSATLYDADGRPFARWRQPSSALPVSSGAGLARGPHPRALGHRRHLCHRAGLSAADGRANI